MIKYTKIKNYFLRGFKSHLPHKFNLFYIITIVIYGFVFRH